MELNKTNKTGISETGFWYQNVANNSHLHSNTLCEYMSTILDKNKQIIDFGCGLGEYLSTFKEKGFEKLVGVEGYKIDNFKFDNIKIQDLTEDFDLQIKGNVISLEVGEHIPKTYEDTFINNITKHCDNLLILSWAVPEQGGVGHCNEQPNDYIISKIVSKGFEFLENETKKIRNYPEDFCCPWFRNTLLIFKKK
jgi:2-polyprenyl-3-methyl-5-hydroxy-6-metoxy-1,4-benzoquinol methylase